MGGTAEVVPFPSYMREYMADRFKTAPAYLP
jgi:hypothetical protein